jgi:hypothetical protein
MIMDLEYVLAELRRERDAIDAAIANLEGLGRPGRPIPDRPPAIPTNGFHRNLKEAETNSKH